MKASTAIEVWVVAVFWALATSAWGQAVYVSQVRTVNADDGFGDSRSDFAADFGPFDGEAQVSGYVTAVAQMTSQLSSDAVSCSSIARLVGSASPATAAARFEVTFDLPQPTDFQITGQGTASGFGDGAIGWRFSLVDGDGLTLYGVQSPAHWGAFNHAGSLAPGRYTVKLRSSGSCGGFEFYDGQAQAQFNMTLVPEPATLVLLAAALPLLRRPGPGRSPRLR